MKRCAAAGVLAVAVGDRVGAVLGPVLADDAQPARRAIMMTDAANTGISPIRQARYRAPHGIGGEWRVTGVSLEGPGCPLQQTCALALALLASLSGPGYRKPVGHRGSSKASPVLIECLAEIETSPRVDGYGSIGVFPKGDVMRAVHGTGDRCPTANGSARS